MKAFGKVEGMQGSLVWGLKLQRRKIWRVRVGLALRVLTLGYGSSLNAGLWPNIPKTAYHPHSREPRKKGMRNNPGLRVWILRRGSEYAVCESVKGGKA